ncbi:hypothetical protein [Paenibacillus mendelii]|uniref:Uncharacterized protein n=1 Tax=Paenibacillus mendelii TaxID=206163 RepID=A0ABV6J6C4_9BACL|nr:hypothetical protein [Paenibacillus mendelii]MCQ6561203.1 hypothetical protein [Paenibacillus mendelii]
MKVVVKLAKSIMENEEGMNHLWIQFTEAVHARATSAELHVQLPDGIYRSRNLNGYVENESQQSIALDLSKDTDILIEVFTQEALDCGEAIITVTLRIGENTSITQEIPLHLANEDEMDELLLDEQVITRLKELSHGHGHSAESNPDFVVYEPRMIDSGKNAFSYLVEKYRVDY